MLLVYACSGTAPRPELEASPPAEPLLPQRVAVAPAAFLPIAEASRLWIAIAQAADACGLRVAHDARIAGGFLELEESTRGLDRASPTVRAMRVATHEVLRDDLGIEGVMYVELVRREARIRDGVARWDGAREPILAVDVDPHDSARGYRGAVDAWSLRLWVEDAAGTVVAEGLGGLAIDARLHAGRWLSAGSGPDLGPPGRLATAIRLAMDDLTQS
jgi:hypothetical protein